MTISKRAKLIETFLNDPKNANTTFAIKHKIMYSRKQISRWLNEITGKVKLDIYVITGDDDKVISIMVRANGGEINNPVLNFDYDSDSQVINSILLVGELVSSGSTYKLRYVKVDKIRDLFEAQLTGKVDYMRIIPGLAKLPFEDLYHHMIEDRATARTPTLKDFKYTFEDIRTHVNSEGKDVSYSVTKDPNKKVWVNVMLDGDGSFKDRLTNVDYSKLDDLMKVRLWLHANELTLNYFDKPEEKTIETNLPKDDPCPTDLSAVIARKSFIDNSVKDQLKKSIFEIIDNNDIDSEIVTKLLDIIIGE